MSLVQTYNGLLVWPLREATVKSRHTYIGLGASVCSAMDIEMRLLHKALVAIGAIANPLLLRLAFSRSRCSTLSCAARAGRLSGLRPRSMSRSRALRGLLCFGLGLNGLHELVDIGLKVDSVFGVDSLVESNPLGISSGVRRD